MALQKIEVKSSIVDTAIFGGGADTRVAVLESSTFSIYQWDLRTKPIAAPCLLATINLRPFLFEDFPRQVALLDQGKILVLASHESGSAIHAFRMESSALEYVQSIPSPAITSIVTAARGVSPTPYLHHSVSGEMLADLGTFDSERGATGNKQTAITVFPKNVSEVKLIDFQSESANQQLHAAIGTGNETISFGLTPNGSLFANKRRLARDCTSFAVTPAHLIYTTTQHFLKLVHMTTVEGS